MPCVRARDTPSNAAIQIDGSCGTIAQLIPAMSSEGGFSQAYVRSGRLIVSVSSTRGMNTREGTAEDDDNLSFCRSER
jgi:hypothetical protein